MERGEDSLLFKKKIIGGTQRIAEVVAFLVIRLG